MNVDLKANVSIKKKIVVNGHEYGSVEELPEDLRKTCLEAMSTAAAPSKVKIVFNGKEYGSVREMPSDIRGIYEGALAAMKPAPFHEWTAGEKNPISPTGAWKKEFSFLEKDADKLDASGSWARWLILGLGILLVLIVLVAVYSLRIE